MPERDIYQIVLQLKDELSAELKEVNAKLTGTRVAGKQAEEATKSFAKQIKSSIAPMRDFARMMREVMMFGGFAIIARQIGNSLASMEKAFVTAHPAMATAAGSAASFAGAVREVEIAIGGKINAILAPFRKWFVDLVAPMQEAKRQLDLFNAAYRELVMAYGSEEQKVAMSLVDLQKARTAQLELYNQKLKERNDLQAIEKGNAAAVLKVWQQYVQAMNDIISGKSKGDATEASRTLSTLMTKKPGEFAPSEQLSALNTILGVLGAGIETIDNYIVGKKAQLGALTEGPIAGVQFGLESTQHAEEVFRDAMLRQASADLSWQMSQTVMAQEELAAVESLVMISEENQSVMIDWKNAWDKGQEKLAMGKQLFSDPTATFSSLLNTAGETTAGVASTAKAFGLDFSMMQQLTLFFGSLAQGISAAVVVGLEMLPIVAIITGLFLIFQGMMEILGPSIEGIWKPIAAVFDLLGNTIGTLLLPIFAALEPVITAVCAVFAPFINLLMLLKPVFDLVGFAIKLLLVPIIAVIIVIVTIMNAVINAINSVIPGTAWDIPLAAVPAMPKFHEGGVARDEMIALLKKGEIVTNPYKNTSYVAGGEDRNAGMLRDSYRIDKQFAGKLVAMGLAEMRA